MLRSFVLLTALPPTKGHARLIEFASRLCGPVKAKVILATQPGEPFVMHRYVALLAAFPEVDIRLHNRIEEQNPDIPGFRERWAEIMREYGMGSGDYLVASEEYGAWLAEMCGARFMPFDIARDIGPEKATRIRDNLLDNFSDIMPQFQHNLRPTITLFGAESTGKTTLSRWLADYFDGWWLPEWARPYLETCGSEINDDSMTAIWKGQMALQDSARKMYDKPFVFQDTDLFSTLGYWKMYNPDSIPVNLVRDCHRFESDLYLITRSNIPFEPDPLRYGGDRRESDDEYWIRLCETHGLNYRVIRGDRQFVRQVEAEQYVLEAMEEKQKKIRYSREY